MIVLLNGKENLTDKLSKILCSKIPNSIIIDSLIIEEALLKMLCNVSNECFNNVIFSIVSEVADKNIILSVNIRELSKLRELYDKLKEVCWNIYKVSVDNSIRKKQLENIAENIIESIYGNRDEFFNKEFLQERNYIVKTNRINLKAANSSHQTLSDIQRVKDVFEVKLQTHPLIIRQELELENLEKYLKSDDKLKLKSVLERVLVKIVEGEEYNSKINKIINSIREIDIREEELVYGERKTNMFIYCMRNIGIPTKYVLGRTKYHQFQAWAETYIKNIGWVPVDVISEIPTDVDNWYFGITNKHIKLFEGTSFEELDLNLEGFEAEISDVSIEM